MPATKIEKKQKDKEIKNRTSQKERGGEKTTQGQQRGKSHLTVPTCLALLSYRPTDPEKVYSGTSQKRRPPEETTRNQNSYP